VEDVMINHDNVYYNIREEIAVIKFIDYFKGTFVMVMLKWSLEMRGQNYNKYLKKLIF
jgi:hypothetical protein